VWGVESEGVGSTVPTKIDTKSLTLPHELYASVSRRLSRRGRRLRAPRVAGAALALRRTVPDGCSGTGDGARTRAGPRPGQPAG